jgi:hypothetical protein
LDASEILNVWGSVGSDFRDAVYEFRITCTRDWHDAASMLEPFQIVPGARIVLIKRKRSVKLLHGSLAIALLFQ